jgi:phosphoribosylaminoimidazole (AIR) synthetase
MNVNKVLCVGAEPLALLDYITVLVPHSDLLGSLAECFIEAQNLPGALSRAAKSLKSKK